MKQVEEKLLLFEKEINNMNNGTKIIQEISQLLRNSITESIQTANSTGSIDERISVLVSGYQNVLDILGEYQGNFLKKDHTIKTKISVLEEVLDEYIVEYPNDLSQE